VAGKTVVARGSLAFTVDEAGPPDGGRVLLLHGFPQHSSAWDALIPLLTDAGYRTLAMDQRGYAPGACPRGRRAYRISELVADAAAVVDHYGGPVHVVGHDWGAAVAWALTSAHPEKVCSLTALSVPHPAAFVRSVMTSVQGLKSWYLLAFQLPWLPEWLLWRWFGRIMQRSGQSPEAARRDAAGFPSSATLRAPLNWYRALPLLDARQVTAAVTRPTLFVWSDRDRFIARASAERAGQYVTAPYRFETLHGVSHWIPDEVPEQLAAFLLSHLKRWSTVF
jgi:pimeloyl-ACP methyl ester carboxylesterase